MTSSRVRAVLLDLEGTLFAGGAALPGAAAAVGALRERGLGVRFLTNIDSEPPAGVAAKLAGLGLDVPVEDLFTPVSAAQALFAAAPDARVLTLLSTALRGDFAHLDGTTPHTHVRTWKYADQQVEGISGSADVTIDGVADLPGLLADGFFG